MPYQSPLIRHFYIYIDVNIALNTQTRFNPYPSHSLFNYKTITSFIKKRKPDQTGFLFLKQLININ